MIRVTEIVFGLEKQWLHHNSNEHVIPWHCCVIGLVIGILCGDSFGRYVLSQWICLMILMGSSLISLILHWQIGKNEKRHLGYWLCGWMMLWLSTGILLGQPGHQSLMPEYQICEVTGRIEQVFPGTPQIRVTVYRWNCGGVRGTGQFKAQMGVQESDLNSGDGLAHGQHFKTMASFERFEAPDVPGMFDSRKWAKSEHLSGRLVRKKTWKPDGTFDYDAHIRIGSNDGGLLTRLERARRKAYSVLSDVSVHGLMPALVLGCSRQIEDEIRESFGCLGIAHVLAVSGLHFGIVALIFNFIFCRIANRSPWIMRRIGKNRFGAVVSVPFLLIYLLFVGAPISARRALIMMAACCMGRVFNRKPDRLRAFSLAAMIILMLDPMAVFSISFQLSFTAVLGIIAGMFYYESGLRLKIQEKDWHVWQKKAVSMFASMVVMTLSTSLSTAPVVIAHFGLLPVFGIWTNLIVIPYVSFILMPVSIVAGIWLISGLPFGEWITSVGGMAESLLVRFADLSVQVIPLSHIELPQHSVVVLIFACFVFVVLFPYQSGKLRRNITLFASISIVLYSIILCAYPRLMTASEELRMSFVSMGQADATLIEFPDGRTMLVDIGSEIRHDENAGETRMMPYLKYNHIKRIDTLVLTHADYDHVAGIIPLLEHIEVGEVWYNGMEHEEMPFWQRAIDEHQIPLIDVTRIPHDQHHGKIQMNILWPTTEGLAELKSAGLLNENESSVVLKIQYQSFSILLMGDAGIAVENILLSNNEILPVTVLKAGHHGSKSASSENWINAVRPEFAIFSVGKNNRYKFPHQIVESHLYNTRTKTYRTDRHGTIRMTTNGHRVLVETMRN